MNLILLFDEDFVEDRQSCLSVREDRQDCLSSTVRLTGRRRDHVMNVHRAAAGDELVIGVCNGRIGTGLVTRLDDEALELRVALDRDPPPPLPLTLVLALPRPKVLNRVIASATSLGVKRIFLINAWRVEKSYWKSPKLATENLFMQCILGLEQARDTMIPSIELRRFFRPFVEEELPSIAAGTQALVGHVWSAATPVAAVNSGTDITLAIGPEGGFIEEEIASLERIGFTPMSIGPRVLRVETAVAALIGRLY
ncbi:MAG TPA: 16S rRNA (uracil(1498)-N(3))-methyltransferase [Thermoanaerobaculia bacterium]|nr:16S rRNA (uracil(1498)-N(3))-methyltransferase [Thermoanaerobaculia bacterium]